SSSYNNRHSQNLDRFRQCDDVMLQLRYRNVSDAREEPNLMVDEEQSGIVRREPVLVFFRFHSLFGSLPRSNWNDHAPTLSTRQIKRKYLVAWFTIRIGYAWAQMELRHLRYFVAVAEEQNVTRAAVRLHVSQPPLSRQIRNLKDELGIALFNRDAKTVRLTEAGRVFLNEARIILQRTDDAVQMAKAVA